MPFNFSGLKIMCEMYLEIHVLSILQEIKATNLH